MRLPEEEVKFSFEAAKRKEVKFSFEAAKRKEVKFSSKAAKREDEDERSQTITVLLSTRQ